MGSSSSTYKMYMLRGFRIVVLSGDQEFAALSELAGNIPSAPRLNWAVASQHCGLIERNIVSSRRRFALSGIVYPLNSYWALWLSVWYCISLNS
jgi:hypothetical protein